jgi:hypothetical protein
MHQWRKRRRGVTRWSKLVALCRCHRPQFCG